MEIKIGKFNFVSNGSEFDLEDFDLKSRFDFFYVDNKKDTLYVNDRTNFDRANQYNLKFEQELLGKFYIIDYRMLIRNKINTFIKEKTMKHYLDNNYSRYDLYNNIDFKKIRDLENERNCSFNFREKITPENRLMYQIDGGYKLFFEPYTEKIENLEEVYKQGLFDKTIKNNLILLEIEKKKAPLYVTHIKEIQNFLKDKQTINVMFKDENKIKVEANIEDILYIRKNEISLNVSGNKKYELKDLESLIFNRTEFKIDIDKLIDLKAQIIQTPADMLSFKIDEMKQNLYYAYSEFEAKQSYHVPSTLEGCISRIADINKRNNQREKEFSIKLKEEYPNWYTEEFKELLKEYERIELLKNAICIDDIKKVAIETGDKELQRIYYILEGEELDEAKEEESEEM